MNQIFQIFFPCNVISSFLCPFTYYNVKQGKRLQLFWKNMKIIG